MPDADPHMEKLYSQLDSIDRKLDAARAERRTSQIVTTLVGALITSTVGFGVWLAQSSLQQHIDAKSKELETKLALKQEVYSRELDRYESVHEQMAALVDALGQVEADPTQKKAADDAINKLYVTYTTDSLYLSNDVISELKELVNVSGSLPLMVSTNASPTQTTGSMQTLDAQIAKIEDQMKQDLKLTQLGQISPEKTKAQP